MDLFKLVGSIVVQNAEANKALDDTADKAKKTGEEIKDASDESEKGSGKMGTFFSKASSAAVTFGKIAITGIAAAGTAIGGLTVSALNAAGELEQNMGGSEAVFAEYATKMQDKSKTAFSDMGLSASDFLATANKMGALFQGAGFGIEESANLSADAMQRAADVASIMGIDTSAAMEAVAGAAKGNFTMMDNLGVAMNDTTLNAYALEKGIGKTTQEMTNQEKIGLAMQLFMEKTAYAAGNYAKENDTLAGSLGTAKAALSNFLSGAGTVEDVVASFSNAAKVIVKNINQMFPSLMSGITSLVNQIVPLIPPLLQQVLPGLIQGATDLINGLVAAMPQIIQALMGALPALITGVTQIFNALVSALPQIIQALVSALPGILPQLVNGIVSMIVMLCTMLPQIIQPIIDNLPMIVTALVNALLQNLPALIQGIKTLIMGVVQALPQIIQVLIDALPILIQGIVSLIMGILQELPQIIQPLIDALPTVISLIVTALIQNLPLLISGAIQLVKGLFNALLAVIGSLFQPIIDWFKSTFPNISNIISTVWDSIKNYISTVINSIKTVIVTVWNSIKNNISTVINAIKNVISTVWNAIKTIITAVVGGIASLIQGDFEGVKHALSMIMNAIKSVFSSVWNGIKSVVGSVVNGIKNTISSVFNGIKNTISSIWNGIKNVTTSVWNGIKNAITKPIETAKNTIKGIIDKIKGFFAGVKLEFPKIKLPHFGISPEGWKIGDLLKGSIPKLAIDWYARAMNNPLLLDKPTIFGYDNATGNLLGGGEAGAEVVAGASTLTGMIRGAVASEVGGVVYYLERLLSLLAEFFPQVLAVAGHDVYLDKRVLVGEMIDEIDTKLGIIKNRKDRGR